MRSTLSLFLILALSACTFQVDIIETPVPTETALPVTSTPTPFPTPDNSATPPPTRTNSTPEPEQLVVSTFPAGGILPIQFPPNGTAQIVVGQVATGASQTYSLRAFKGQIMSVSIQPGDPQAQVYFTLQIQGSDGTVLCPVNNHACPFWRGELPSTQDYFVKVIALDGGSFKMRVAINPQGQANQFFDYADPQGRYSLSYSDEFGPMLAQLYNAGDMTKFRPELALQYIDTRQYVPTNLSEAYFFVGSSTDSQSVSTCTQPASLGGTETVLGEININSVVFTKSQGIGVGAGNIYEQTFYRTVHNGTCYEITYAVHYGNIGAYTGDVRDFDHDDLLQKFDQVTASFVMK